MYWIMNTYAATFRNIKWKMTYFNKSKAPSLIFPAAKAIISVFGPLPNCQNEHDHNHKYAEKEKE